MTEQLRHFLEDDARCAHLCRTSSRKAKAIVWRLIHILQWVAAMGLQAPQQDGDISSEDRLHAMRFLGDERYRLNRCQQCPARATKLCGTILQKVKTASNHLGRGGVDGIDAMNEAIEELCVNVVAQQPATEDADDLGTTAAAGDDMTAQNEALHLDGIIDTTSEGEEHASQPGDDVEALVELVVKKVTESCGERFSNLFDADRGDDVDEDDLAYFITILSLGVREHISGSADRALMSDIYQQFNLVYNEILHRHQFLVRIGHDEFLQMMYHQGLCTMYDAELLIRPMLLGPQFRRLPNSFAHSGSVFDVRTCSSSYRTSKFRRGSVRAGGIDSTAMAGDPDSAQVPDVGDSEVNEQFARLAAEKLRASMSSSAVPTLSELDLDYIRSDVSATRFIDILTDAGQLNVQIYPRHLAGAAPVASPRIGPQVKNPEYTFLGTIHGVGHNVSFSVFVVTDDWNCAPLEAWLKAAHPDASEICIENFLRHGRDYPLSLLLNCIAAGELFGLDGVTTAGPKLSADLSLDLEDTAEVKWKTESASFSLQKGNSAMPDVVTGLHTRSGSTVPGIDLTDALRFFLLFHARPRLVVFHAGGKMGLEQSRELMRKVHESRVQGSPIHLGVGTQTLQSTAKDAAGKWLGDSLFVHLSKSDGILGIGHHAQVENFPVGAGAGLKKMEDGSVAVTYGSSIVTLQPGAANSAVEDFRRRFPHARGQDAFYSSGAAVIENFTLYNTIHHNFRSRGRNAFDILQRRGMKQGATAMDARKVLEGLLHELGKSPEGRAALSEEMDNDQAPASRSRPYALRMEVKFCIHGDLDDDVLLSIQHAMSLRNLLEATGIKLCATEFFADDLLRDAVHMVRAFGESCFPSHVADPTPLTPLLVEALVELNHTVQNHTGNVERSHRTTSQAKPGSMLAHWRDGDSIGRAGFIFHDIVLAGIAQEQSLTSARPNDLTELLKVLHEITPALFRIQRQLQQSAGALPTNRHLPALTTADDFWRLRVLPVTLAIVEKCALRTASKKISDEAVAPKICAILITGGKTLSGAGVRDLMIRLLLTYKLDKPAAEKLKCSEHWAHRPILFLKQPECVTHLATTMYSSLTAWSDGLLTKDGLTKKARTNLAALERMRSVAIASVGSVAVGQNSAVVASRQPIGLQDVAHVGSDGIVVLYNTLGVTCSGSAAKRGGHVLPPQADLQNDGSIPLRTHYIAFRDGQRAARRSASTDPGNPSSSAGLITSVLDAFRGSFEARSLQASLASMDHLRDSWNNRGAAEVLTKAAKAISLKPSQRPVIHSNERTIKVAALTTFPDINKSSSSTATPAQIIKTLSSLVAPHMGHALLLPLVEDSLINIGFHLTRGGWAPSVKGPCYLDHAVIGKSSKKTFVVWPIQLSNDHNSMAVCVVHFVTSAKGPKAPTSAFIAVFNGTNDDVDKVMFYVTLRFAARCKTQYGAGVARPLPINVIRIETPLKENIDCLRDSERQDLIEHHLQDLDTTALHALTFVIRLVSSHLEDDRPMSAKALDVMAALPCSNIYAVIGILRKHTLALKGGADATSHNGSVPTLDFRSLLQELFEVDDGIDRRPQRGTRVECASVLIHKKAFQIPMLINDASKLLRSSPKQLPESLLSLRASASAEICKTMSKLPPALRWERCSFFNSPIPHIPDSFVSTSAARDLHLLLRETEMCFKRTCRVGRIAELRGGQAFYGIANTTTDLCYMSSFLQAMRHLFILSPRLHDGLGLPDTEHVAANDVIAELCERLQDLDQLIPEAASRFDDVNSTLDDIPGALLRASTVYLLLAVLVGLFVGHSKPPVRQLRSLLYLCYSADLKTTGDFVDAAMDVFKEYSTAKYRDMSVSWLYRLVISEVLYDFKIHFFAQRRDVANPFTLEYII